jgi:hypothetical protein
MAVATAFGELSPVLVFGSAETAFGIGVVTAISYTPPHEHELSKQPLQHRVGLHATVPAKQVAAWKSAPALPSFRLPCVVLSAPHRLQSLADKENPFGFE